MLLPIKAILSNSQRKDGSHIIYFQYCYCSTNRVLLRTDIAIPVAYWNKKRQLISKSLPTEWGETDNLNGELMRMLKVIEAIIAYGKTIDAENLGEYVKSLFTPSFKLEGLGEMKTSQSKLKRVEFFDEIDDYIKSKDKKVVSVGAFKGMKERLRSFEEYAKEKIMFSRLDFSFYTAFVDYLTYDYVQRRRKEIQYGLKLSTIGSTIKNLRVFVNDRVRRKVILPVDLKDFKIVDEEADAIYLSYEEVGRVYYADLSQYPHLEEYRDLFVLGCLTGLRFSDYSNLEFKDFRKGMLYKKQQKTSDWVVIPLKKEAKEIFVRQLSKGTPKVSNPLFNRYIKEIAKIAGITEQITFSYRKGNKNVVITKPKYEWVTSHTCRRSFCTNEYLAGTDVNLIMKISGHKTYKDFFKYIRISQEEAAKRLLDLWSAKGNLEAFSLTQTA